MVMVSITAPSVLDVADRELVLQICGSIRHGQIVRLKSTKCTIGSGPRSTLRLRAPGVQPLHCLILRGAAGTVIRRFAADTRLNGRGFTDAPLVAGDRLTIGPIEFTVLEGSRLPEGRPAQAPPAAEREKGVRNLLCEAPSGPFRQEVPDTFFRELHELRARLASANRHGRSRARRLLRELRSARKQLLNKELQRHDQPDRDSDELEQLSEQLDQRRSELDALALRLGQQEDALRQQEESLAEQSEKLGALLAELVTKQHSFHDEREKWDKEQAKAERRLQERTAELDKRSRQLDARSKLSESSQTEFDSRQAALDARQAEVESRQVEVNALHAELYARQAELDARQTEVESRQAEVNALQAELDARQARLDAGQAEVNARQAELDARQAELDSRQAELDSRQARLDARESEIDQRCREIESGRTGVATGRDQPPEECDPQEGIQFEKRYGGSPESSEEVLRRLGIGRSFSDEQAEDQPPSMPEPAQGDAARAPDSHPQSEPDKEESIDDYMARLLDRVRSSTSRSGEPASLSVSSVRTGVRAPTPAATPEPGDSPPQPPLPGGGQEGPVEMSPRAVAPEKSMDLGAMRDLANLSAHTAINRHARRVLVGNVTSKLAVTIVGLAAGGVLTWIWWTRSLEDLTLYAAATCFLVALLWGTRHVLWGACSIFSRSGQAGRKPGGDGQATIADSQTAPDQSS